MVNRLAFMPFLGTWRRAYGQDVMFLGNKKEKEDILISKI